MSFLLSGRASRYTAARVCATRSLHVAKMAIDAVPDLSVRQPSVQRKDFSRTGGVAYRCDHWAAQPQGCCPSAPAAALANDLHACGLGLSVAGMLLRAAWGEQDPVRNVGGIARGGVLESKSTGEWTTRARQSVVGSGEARGV